MEPVIQLAKMPQATGRYREYAPCEALRKYVRSFFTFAAPAGHDLALRPVTREILFGPGVPFSAPLFADGHVSLSFSFGDGYRVEGLWHPGSCGPHAHLIGAMTTARRASHGSRIVEVGAYFRAAAARAFTSAPASELTDRIVALRDLWGVGGSELETQIYESKDDAARISRLESALIDRIGRERSRRVGIDLPGLTNWMLLGRGGLTIEDVARAAGVSRQHLGRVFREEVGVTPKLYCRLARFRAALACAAAGNSDGADLAIQMGYTDQSHMIAEFREFSSFTPAALTIQRRFHPFIEQPLSG